MALVPSFTASQIIGQPNIIRLTDTSNGSDVTITQRRAYLQKVDGIYLVPTGTSTSYIAWDYVNATIDANVLTQDTAETIKVDWIDVSNVILYTYTISSVQTLYAQQYDFSLIAQEQSNQAILNSTNWVFSRMQLRLAINDAQNAISLANDIANAQAACDRGTALINNPNLFF